MLDYSFSEEQEMLRATVRNFAQKELAPGVKERYKTRHFPKGLVKKMADLGLLGLSIPEKYGGSASDAVSFGIVSEELSKVDPNSNFYVFDNYIQDSFLLLATEEVKEEWLPALARGEKLILMGATEAEAGSDLGNLKSTAKKDGEYYILNGEKNSVSHATDGDAMVALVKLDTSSKKSITAFLVPFNAPGVTISPIEDMGTMVGGNRCIVSMEDVRIHEKYILGGGSTNMFAATMKGFDATRASEALAALGTAQASLNETCEYVKQRVAFGKPIAKFEGVSFPLAEMATYIELGRTLAYKTLWMIDQGMTTTKESAMLHWWVPQKANWIHHQCLLLHGHYGFSKDLPFEARLRDSYTHLLGEAPLQIMKVIISRELLGREYLPY